MLNAICMEQFPILWVASESQVADYCDLAYSNPQKVSFTQKGERVKDKEFISEQLVKKTVGAQMKKFKVALFGMRGQSLNLKVRCDLKKRF